MGNKQQVTVKSAQEYVDAVAKAEQSGDESFFFWFNACSDLNSYFASGIQTLETEILTPTVQTALGPITSSLALEIGHGGGRILIAACSKFKHVTGIDVHQSNDPVKRKLNRAGLANYSLQTTDGSSIPNNTNSLDFIYSYIVLMHVPNIDIFRDYLSETHRVLRPGGVAQLFYGRYSRMSWKARIRWCLAGYREISSTNYSEDRNKLTNLVLTQRTAHKIARDIGFNVLDSGSSLKPDGIQKGSQNYMTLQVPL